MTDRKSNEIVSCFWCGVNIGERSRPFMGSVTRNFAQCALCVTALANIQSAVSAAEGAMRIVALSAEQLGKQFLDVAEAAQLATDCMSKIVGTAARIQDAVPRH